jgi:hypothetical protein
MGLIRAYAGHADGGSGRARAATCAHASLFEFAAWFYISTRPSSRR